MKLPRSFVLLRHTRLISCPNSILPFSSSLPKFLLARKVSIQSQNRTKMNHCSIQQNSNFSSFGNGDPVVCPKPRRINLFNTTVNEPVRHLRWNMCYPQEPYESKSGPELLDIILAKSGGYGSPDRTCTPIGSSPPFFCGSPPSRVSNPLIQDARFGDEKLSPISPRSVVPNRPSYGNKPAVRIEGFDCLDRDNRRNCSIPALG